MIKLIQTLMNVLKITVDIHRSPSQSDHTRSELKLQILKMWLKEIFGNWLNLSKNFLMLIKNILKLVEVHLEFFFLKENDSSCFWDLNMLSFKTFSFTNKLKNSNIEVDIK